MWIKEVSPNLAAAVAKAWKLEGEANVGWAHDFIVSAVNEYFDSAFDSSLSFPEWLKEHPYIYVLKRRKAGHGKMTTETSFFDQPSERWVLRIAPEYSLSEDKKNIEINLIWGSKSALNNPIKSEVREFYAVNGAP